MLYGINYMWNPPKTVKFIETESRMVVLHAGVGGGREILSKRYKFLVIRCLSSGGLMHSMVTIAKNTILYA